MICTAVVIVIGVYDRGPQLYSWTKSQHMQWRFLRYTAPSDRVVVETDDARAKMLLSRPGYVSVPQAIHMSAFYPASIPQMAAGPEAVLFLHERMTPKGERRLVSFSIALDPGASLYTAIYRPTWNGLQRLGGEGRVRRIFAGQPDAADPTHFTIRYEADGQERILDGWLQNDDSVKFQDRGPVRGFFALWPSY
jgi:hypothetical protein